MRNLIILLLSLTFLGIQPTKADPDAPFKFKSGDKDVVTIERSYTASIIKKDKLCNNSNLSSVCDFLVDNYSRRFEREMVIRINQSIDFDSPDFSSFNRERSYQYVRMFLHDNSHIAVTTLYSFFKIVVPDHQNSYSIETFNYDMEKKNVLRFSDLFEDSETAAMLCARHVEEKFKNAKSYLLPVVIAAVELEPHNFIITKKGIRLFFASGLLSSQGQPNDECDIAIEDLKDAKPFARFWPQLANETEENK